MNTTESPACPQCPGPFMDGPAANYEHIHQVKELPRARRTDSLIIRRGYAVGFGGGLPQTWVFFQDLEPALVFGRAGRMSEFDISGYGVYEAAREDRFEPQMRQDIATLYIDMTTDVQGRPEDGFGHRDDEHEIYARWIRGCDPEKSHYAPEKARTRR